MPRTSPTIIGRLLLVVAIPVLLSMASLGGVAGQTLGDECTNPEVGYTVPDTAVPVGQR